MWKSIVPSKLFVKCASTRSLTLPEMLNAQQPSRDDGDTEAGLCDHDEMKEESAPNTRRLSLRRMSSISLRRCMSFRVKKSVFRNSKTTNNEGDSSLSRTNSSDENSSVKSSLSTSSSSSTAATRKKQQSTIRSVRFSVVQVREFDRTVGENPACKAGPPLTLDWSFVERPDKWLCDDDDDDSCKNDNETTKRTLQQLLVSSDRRIELLRDEWDITESELAACMQVVHQIQKSRQEVVTEFRELLALKRKQQQAAQKDVAFSVTRLEC